MPGRSFWIKFVHCIFKRHLILMRQMSMYPRAACALPRPTSECFHSGTVLGSSHHGRLLDLILRGPRLAERAAEGYEFSKSNTLHQLYFPYCYKTFFADYVSRYFPNAIFLTFFRNYLDHFEPKLETVKTLSKGHRKRGS